MTGVLPIDYEKEISEKYGEIKRDQLRDLLLFPEDSVTVMLLIFFHRIFVKRDKTVYVININLVPMILWFPSTSYFKT